MVIFIHRYLDSDNKFLNFCIPDCLMIHLNIIIQHRHQSSKILLNRASAMLNNVFKMLWTWDKWDCNVSLQAQTIIGKCFGKSAGKIHGPLIKLPSSEVHVSVGMITSAWSLMCIIIENSSGYFCATISCTIQYLLGLVSVSIKVRVLSSFVGPCLVFCASTNCIYNFIYTCLQCESLQYTYNA